MLIYKTKNILNKNHVLFSEGSPWKFSCEVMRNQSDTYVIKCIIYIILAVL